MFDIHFSSVQSLSHVRLFATPWIIARQASLSITNSQSLLRLVSIKSVMPSNHLTLCCPLLLLPPIPPRIRVFSNESTLRMRWPKYWSFSFSISPSNEHAGLTSFRMDWLDLLSSWGSQGKNTEVVYHSLLQWTTFWQTSPPRPVRLGWPHTAWLSFTELDKAVVCVIRRFREGFLRSGLISGWKVVELDRERERNYV